MSDKPSLVFLVAMRHEIENIFDVHQWTEEVGSAFPTLKHKNKSSIVIVQTGITKTNAASATQYAIDKYQPSRVVNLGTVGSLNPKIGIGELRSISTCRFFDIDVTAFDYELGQVPESATVNYQLKNTKSMLTAKLITGDIFVTNPKLLLDVLKVYDADFIDMEAAAIAHTMYRNKVLGHLEVYKAPSDYCNNNSSKDFYNNEDLTFGQLRELASKLIEEEN